MACQSICWEAANANLSSRVLPALLCSPPLAQQVQDWYLPEIPPFIKGDTTLQIKSSSNERDQNHQPALKVQAGPWRPYETPGLYFQKEGAKVTFGDPLLMMPKGRSQTTLLRHHRS